MDTRTTVDLKEDCLNPGIVSPMDFLSELLDEFKTGNNQIQLTGLVQKKKQMMPYQYALEIFFEKDKIMELLNFYNKI